MGQTNAAKACEAIKEEPACQYTVTVTEKKERDRERLRGRQRGKDGEKKAERIGWRI